MSNKSSKTLRKLAQQYAEEAKAKEKAEKRASSIADRMARAIADDGKACAMLSELGYKEVRPVAEWFAAHAATIVAKAVRETEGERAAIRSDVAERNAARRVSAAGERESSSDQGMPERVPGESSQGVGGQRQPQAGTPLY